MTRQELILYPDKTIKTFKEFYNNKLVINKEFNENGFLIMKTEWIDYVIIGTILVTKRFYSNDVCIKSKTYVKGRLYYTTLINKENEFIQFKPYDSSYHGCYNTENGSMSGSNYNGRVLMLTKTDIIKNNMDKAKGFGFEMLAIPDDFEGKTSKLLNYCKHLVKARNGKIFYYLTK